MTTTGLLRLICENHMTYISILRTWQTPNTLLSSGRGSNQSPLKYFSTNTNVGTQSPTYVFFLQ